jgi:tetratricopeptide (TPR) repeat protein
MYRRMERLIGIAVLAVCASGIGAAGDAASLVRDADVCVSERKFDRAQALYERAQAEGMEFERDLPRARNLAAVYLNGTPQDLTKAIHWLQIAVTLDPQSDSLRAQLASSLYRSGNLDAALDHYRVLAEAHPTSAEYTIPLATLLRQAGKSDAALQFLQASTEKYPGLVAIRIEYARQLNFTRQFAEARKQFSAVLAIEPQNLIAQVGMAKSTSYEGDQETALEMYDRILQRHPGSYDAMVGKAFSLLWSGRTEQAGLLLRQASVRDPDDREVHAALSALPHPAGAPEAMAMPEHRSRRVDVPHRAVMRRAPDSEKPEAKATLPPVPAIPVQPEQPILQKEPQPRYPVPVAVAGFCLALAFLYGRLRARHFKLREEKAESLSRKRTPDFTAPMVDSRNHSIGHKEPESAAVVGAEAQIPMTESIPPACSPYDCTSKGDQQSFVEDSAALPAMPLVKVDADAGGKNQVPYSCAPHPGEASLDRVQGGVPDFPLESREPLAGAQELEANAKLRILLVGGLPEEVELEKLWFPIAGSAMVWERNWAEAVDRLASAPPDLIVLNVLSDDGKTSKQMFDWIVANRPEFRDRTIVICGLTGAGRREQDGPGAYLVEPFGAPQWRQAILSLAPRQTRRHSPLFPQVHPERRVAAIVLTRPGKKLAATDLESLAQRVDP